MREPKTITIERGSIKIGRKTYDFIDAVITERIDTKRKGSIYMFKSKVINANLSERAYKSIVKTKKNAAPISQEEASAKELKKAEKAANKKENEEAAKAVAALAAAEAAAEAADLESDVEESEAPNTKEEPKKQNK